MVAKDLRALTAPSKSRIDIQSGRSMRMRMHCNIGTVGPGSYLGGAVTRYDDSGASIVGDMLGIRMFGCLFGRMLRAG